MMRKAPAVLLCLFVFAVGCSSGLKSQILGKWEPQEEGLNDKGVVIEITDRKIKTSDTNGAKLASHYRFVGGDAIETETLMFGKKCKYQYKVVINGDEMAWTDKTGKTRSLKRIK